jgi:hypothetical protein
MGFSLGLMISFIYSNLTTRFRRLYHNDKKRIQHFNKEKYLFSAKIYLKDFLTQGKDVRHPLIQKGENHSIAEFCSMLWKNNNL